MELLRPIDQPRNEDRVERRAIAKQRLEFIIQNDPVFPGAQEKLTEALLKMAIPTATITPKPLGILGLTGVAATDRTYDGTTTVAVTVSTSGRSRGPSVKIRGDTRSIISGRPAPVAAVRAASPR